MYSSIMDLQWSGMTSDTDRPGYLTFIYVGSIQPAWIQIIFAFC